MAAPATAPTAEMGAVISVVHPVVNSKNKTNIKIFFIFSPLDFLYFI
jgi:hypothetical protein